MRLTGGSCAGSEADLAARAKHAVEVGAPHAAVVGRELEALDRHAADVAAWIEALEGMSGAVTSYSLQESRAQVRQFCVNYCATLLLISTRRP